MKIEMHAKERSTLTGFADKHDLVMEVHERSPQDFAFAGPRAESYYRYYAHFKRCEVKDGSILSSPSGNGATPDDAMADYAKKISEKLLVFNAASENRREIFSPILTHVAE